MNIKIVSNKFNEDVSWIENSKYEKEIIEKEINYGNEALSYLIFICKNYNKLPDKVAFIHGHEYSYHQQYHILEAIEKYKDQDFISLNGENCIAYNYLNRNHPWFPSGELNYGLFDFFWNELMSDFGSCPKKLIFQPCAQFIVDKKLILSNSLDFYQQIHNFILDKKLGKIIAVFLEFVWHIIFTKKNIENHIYNQNLDQWCIQNNINVYIKNGNSLNNNFNEPLIYIHKNKDWISHVSHL